MSLDFGRNVGHVIDGVSAPSRRWWSGKCIWPIFNTEDRGWWHSDKLLILPANLNARSLFLKGFVDGLGTNSISTLATSTHVLFLVYMDKLFSFWWKYQFINWGYFHKRDHLMADLHAWFSFDWLSYNLRSLTIGRLEECCWWRRKSLSCNLQLNRLCPPFSSFLCGMCLISAFLNPALGVYWDLAVPCGGSSSKDIRSVILVGKSDLVTECTTICYYVCYFNILRYIGLNWVNIRLVAGLGDHILLSSVDASYPTCFRSLITYWSEREWMTNCTFIVMWINK